jgi:hypothetical protein
MGLLNAGLCRDAGAWPAVPQMPMPRRRRLAALLPLLLALPAAAAAGAQPADTTTVVLDPAALLVVNGEREFPRERLITLHGLPNAAARACGTGGTPARAMWNPAGGWPLRLGEQAQALPRSLPPPLSASPCATPGVEAPLMALTVGRWPEALSEPRFPGTGTPRNPEEAADFLIGQMAPLSPDGAAPPLRFLEPRNESDIPSNWGWHWRPEAWSRNAEFHRVVAERLRARFPGLCVGGPAYAWPHFDAGDWRGMAGLAEFLRIAGPSLDFLSFHAYQRIRPARPDVPEPALQPALRWSATIDVLQGCARAVTGRSLPVVVTEYGGLLPQDATETEQRRFLEVASGALAAFADRTDAVALAVPFILPAAPWQPDYPYLACRWEDRTPRPTRLAGFFELWRDLGGQRIATEGDGRVVALAWREEAALNVMLANPSRAAAQVTLRLPDGQGFSEGSVRRFAASGAVETTPLPTGGAILLDPGEVARLRLPAPPGPQRHRSLWREPAPFCPTGPAGPARIELTTPATIPPGATLRLRLVLAAPEGLAVPPKLRVDGRETPLTVLGGTPTEARFLGTALATLGPVAASTRLSMELDMPHPGRLAAVAFEVESSGGAAPAPPPG